MLAMKAFCLLASASSSAPWNFPATAALPSTTARRAQARELPGVIAQDAHRRVIVGLRGALASEEAHGHVPGALDELRGSKADVHVVWIGERALVVAAAIARIRAALAPAHAARSLERMGGQQPVGEID